MKKITMLIIVIAVIILALVAGRFYLTQSDMGLSNPYWNGLYHMSGETRPLYDTGELSGYGANTTLLVINPQTNYTASESGAVMSFLSRGGQVVVMDDYGNANSLLSGIGSPIMLNQVPLCQDVDFYLRPSLPVIKNITSSSMTANVSSLVCDHPVSLNLTSNATPLASTTNFGWLDYNDNGLLDKTEPSGIYTVAAEASYGKGMLVVFGDPDLLINSMQDKGDNAVLASNILASGTVYVDVGHGQSIPPLEQLYYLAKFNVLAQLACVLAILLLAGLYYLRNDLYRLVRKPEEKSEEPVDTKAAIIERLKKTPLTKEQIEELKRKL